MRLLQIKIVKFFTPITHIKIFEKENGKSLERETGFNHTGDLFIVSRVCKRPDLNFM